MAKVFKKWQCPDSGCRRWFRGPGVCTKCGKPLRQREAWSLDYEDANRKRRIEDLETHSKQAAKSILVSRQEEARQRIARPSKDTFAGVAAEYVELASTKKADGGTRDEFSLRHLLPFFGKMKMAEIQRRDVEKYLSTRRAAPATVVKEFNLFKSIWSWALQHEIVRHVPHYGVKPPSISSPPMRPVSEEDEERLFASLPTGAREFFRFIRLTGARYKEALNLQHSDIEGRIAWVWSAKTRSGAKERQPLHLDDEAAAILAEQKRRWPNEEAVWISPKSKKPYRDLDAILRRHAKALGIDLRGVHRLRHLFVTRLIEEDVPEAIVRDLARHKTPTMLKRYTHLRNEKYQEALAKRRKK